MNLLLDTHALIWFLEGNETAISAKAKRLISDPANTSYVSVASLWEMAIKIRLGSLSFAPGYDNLLPLLDQNGFEVLPITFQHTRRLITLPMHHRDPFDRLLIAQAMTESLLLITIDTNIHQYAIDCAW
jgi:PIN domain nuclease of toxin-antitoxin system